jgi:hypothetical protein
MRIIVNDIVIKNDSYFNAATKNLCLRIRRIHLNGQTALNLGDHVMCDTLDKSTQTHRTQQLPGARRARLWELNAYAHGPLIGICLPAATLRRLCRRLDIELGDRDVHELAVDACGRHSALAELMQRDLDRRHRLSVHRSMPLTSSADLDAWWRQHADAHALPGALWATISHPCCTAELTRALHTLADAPSPSDGPDTQAPCTSQDKSLLRSL